jgi:hypothetical protein
MDEDRKEFHAKDDVTTFEAEIPPNFEGWVVLNLASADHIKNESNYWIYLNEHDELEWGYNDKHYPGYRRGYYSGDDEKWYSVRWARSQFYDRLFSFRGTFCFRTTGAQPPFPASYLNNGQFRPFLKPNLWISSTIDSQKEHTEVVVQLKETSKLSSIILTFDTDLDKAFPHKGYGEEGKRDWPIGGKAPNCIKDLDIFSIDQTSNARVKIAEIRENYQRVVKVVIENPIDTQRLIFVPLSNWGAKNYSLYEIRLY